MPEERRVTTEVQIALQPQAGSDPAAALTAAAAKLARQSLEMLVQQAGQPLTGKIVPPPPNLPAGMAQIAVADMVLTLKLSTPLPPGTPVRIDVQQTPGGQPAVVVQPTPANVPQPSMPAPAMPSNPAPNLPLPTAAQPAPQPQVAPQPPAAQQAAMVQTAVQGQAPAVVTAPQSRPAPTTPQPASTSTPAPASTQAASPMPTAQPAPQASVAAQPATTAPAPQPVTTSALPTPAAPQPGAPVTPQVATATPPPVPTTPAPAQPSHMPMATPQPQPAVTTQMPAPAPAAAAPQAGAPAAPASPAAPAQTSAAPVAPPVPVQPTTSQPQMLMQRLAQAFAQPAAPAPAAPPAPGTPAQMVMAATTQAAAQQQSAAPLMQTLAASMPLLPTPVAEAAARVLATRVNLDRGAPSGESLKQAVLKSGVFLDAPAKLGSQPDIRQALGQLRGTLLAWLGDDLAPVAAISRRPAPPPPAKGSAPRGQAPEQPQSLQGDAKEAGKSLLSQTEGALARVKLMQLSTQPADPGRPGATMASPAEWNLELPMMLGHELAMAQLQIARDGKGKEQAKDKSWRLRFALKFSMIGEVGAQISMVGRRTSVAIWADEDATADALEAMLPDLGHTLAAKGLELISLTIRRGAPREDAVPAGRLMDSVT
jgi:hypothetical protein